ncbi:MAG TPA: hypothetical protein VKA16_00855 [Burkholderiales bacterium]|nr:hypothetical protein [Burkholderiales bacterium]
MIANTPSPRSWSGSGARTLAKAPRCGKMMRRRKNACLSVSHDICARKLSVPDNQSADLISLSTKAVDKFVDCR